MLFMSNNQWKCDVNNDTWRAMGMDCSAEARSAGFIRAYLDVLPDVIGVQEASEKMTALILKELFRVKLADGTKANYVLVSGGDTPILYRKDKLRLLESGHLCYPESVPGYEGSFNNQETKSYTYGVFEDRTTHQVFAYCSTHLWYMSSDPSKGRNYREGSNFARAYQFGIVSEKMDEVMKRYACPGFIVGDLNAAMHSMCLDRAYAEGWTDVHDLAVGECDQTRGHHPCGGGGFSRGEAGTFDQAIDHILIKNGENVRIERFCRLTDEWYDCISDHYPLYTEVTFG